jgi:para-aminobenzoate synthetase component 1
LLISQPIKGTAKRFSDPIEDEIQKKQLALDPKNDQKT